MNYIMIIIVPFLIIGCASNGKERLKKAGYTDHEIQKMDPYLQSYTNLMSKSFGSGVNITGVGMVQKNSDQLQKIYCNCISKLKEKCESRLAGLSLEEEKIWLKAHAAKAVNNSYSTEGSNLLLGQRTSEISEAICLN